MITAADIDVTIPGEVASVDAAAQWLEGLRDNAEDANGLLNAAALTEISSGEVSAAVTSYALTLWQCSMDVYVRATDAADVNRAFADQLGWRKDDMKEHLETARGDGLTVIGNIEVFSPDAFVEGEDDQGCGGDRGDGSGIEGDVLEGLEVLDQGVGPLGGSPH